MVELYLDEAILNESKLLEDGIYEARIVETGYKQYGKMDADYLRINFDVIDKNGIAKNIYHDFHLYHPNEMAKKIGHNQLAEICGCVDMDVHDLKESDNLLGKELNVKIMTEKSDEYGDRNKIIKFLVSYLNNTSNSKKKDDKSFDSEMPW